MEQKKYSDYLQILKEELVPAMGCTEPIAIAYAAAKAREVLGKMPEKVIAKCSGNIIKNAMCVTVPNTGDLVGIKASSIIGVLAGDSSKELEVINEVKEEHIKEANKLMNEEYCFVERLESDIQLHIVMEVYNGNESALVEIKYAHNNISKVIKNGEVLFEGNEDPSKYLGVFIDRSILNVNDIIAIAKEGLNGEYGVGIGKMLMKCYPNSIITKLKVYAAAASEARMSGCSLPVMTNSGSGNQGMATSIPVIIYAKEKGLTEEELYRGLVFSNLITIHQKTGIGRLSAFCGAVSAGCASGAAITYLEGGTLEQINKTVTNTLANISGIVCDGAKASCAAKIATSVDAGMMAHYLAMEDKSYVANTGILKENIEKTITAVGRLGKEGMKETDKEILEIMLEG